MEKKLLEAMKALIESEEAKTKEIERTEKELDIAIIEAENRHKEGLKAIKYPHKDKTLFEDALEFWKSPDGLKAIGNAETIKK